jgi:hypothetical protein
VASSRDIDRKRWRRSLVSHLEDYPRQLEALRFSTRTFGADFDLAEFAAAFSSDDPALYTRVQAIERALGRLQSYMAAMAEDGTKLAGLDRRSPKDREPKSQPAFEALRDAEVITKDLAAGSSQVDASVIATCEELDEPKVATLDRRAFSVVRPRHREYLTLLPE